MWTWTRGSQSRNFLIYRIREDMTRYLTFALLTCLVFIQLTNGDVITAADIDKVATKLEQALGEKNIPDEVQKWLAVLDKNINLLNCLPMKRVGNCFKSNQCILPELKFDGKQLKAELSLCKDPWKIVIDFELPKLPWWVDVKFDSIVIPINHNVADGVTTINSVSRANAKFLGLINVFKAELQISAILRWDCTKPTDDRFKRAQYNSKAPNQRYDSLWYTFKVRIEAKVKKFPCFCYKCKKCEDLVNKSGTLSDGRNSCSPDDITWYNQEVEFRRKACAQYAQCIVRSFFRPGHCSYLRPGFSCQF